MKENPFKPSFDHYQRDVNILKHYGEQVCIFLSRRFGITQDEARAYMATNLKPDGRFPYKEPQCRYLERNEHGDREEKFGSLNEYIMGSVREEEPIAPTFTTYVPVKKKKSILAEYIEENAKIRKALKKEMITAGVQAGNAKTPEEKHRLTELKGLKNIGQKYAKQKNNSLSGTAASASTAFVNPSAHSTLTSVTRSTSGYANANNERFIMGSRHYWSPRTVLNALTAYIGRCNTEEVQKALDMFSIHVPSVDDVMDCIEYSSAYYWRPIVADAAWKDLREYVGTMTDVERACFVYSGDFYHLKKHNPELIRDFITRLTQRGTIAVDDPKTIYWNASESTRVLAAQICTELTLGLTLAEIADVPDVVREVAMTCASIEDALYTYTPLIKGLMRAILLPGSIAYFPHAVRRAVIMSDTDSTIYTVEHWTEWMTKDVVITPDSRKVTAAMVYLVENVTGHVLSTMAMNMGVAREHLSIIDMKNEYTFEVFAATMGKKHYYCLQTVLEGQQLKEPGKELKGVGLVASTIPKIIKSEIHDTMVDIMFTLRNGEKLSLNKLIGKAVDMEKRILHDLEQGSAEYFKYVKVKDKGAYKNAERAPAYQQHTMWNQTFALTYGESPPLPYTSVKISLDLPNKSKLAAWMDSIQDPKLSEALKGWVKENGKSNLKTLHMPLAIIQSKGIPKEILEAADSDKIVYTMMSPMYMAYQAIGIHLSQSKMFHHVYG